MTSTYQVVNPSTGEAGRSYPESTDAEVQDVLARSDAAFRSWHSGLREIL